MNAIAFVVLIALAADFFLHLLADGLNLKHLSHRLPKGFESIFDAQRYRQSQRYLKAHTQFGWIASAFQLIALLAFWFAHGFPWLDRWVRSFGLGPILSGLLFIGVLLVFKAALSLPFSIYKTFGIEARFGFNKTTPTTYILDLLKGFLLAILLGVPLLAGILAFFEYAGP
ncbi:MAG: M48 family peptidase, partial [Desulfobacterales bacterium]|nr:M48 family peptidase [Desulfobacterales bacterium]